MKDKEEKDKEALYKEFESNPLKKMTKEIGNNIFPKTATFILKKDTVISCLYELMGIGFCSYEGDKEWLKDTSKFEDEHFLKITENDWKNIALPWNILEPIMKSYYEILNQAPKEWFKKNID